MNSVTHSHRQATSGTGAVFFSLSPNIPNISPANWIAGRPVPMGMVFAIFVRALWNF